MEIAKIVMNPEALNVEYYVKAGAAVELLMDEASPIAGVQIKTLDTSKYVIVAITRKHRTIVPVAGIIFMPVTTYL
jgi:Trk K+ transport system NAD-binding subunit